ncbi:hypothetical protein MLD38_013521 [Melastoma candidum]|uniref:Uncharacterized protein n=1 Tax=Melastoma candidum TaxID=119954 RepID=A0ACB9RB46_9MYRT|nr:hypothetical protein MLD38_013521 [Melastoma candidum]
MIRIIFINKSNLESNLRRKISFTREKHSSIHRYACFDVTTIRFTESYYLLKGLIKRSPGADRCRGPGSSPAVAIVGPPEASAAGVVLVWLVRGCEPLDQDKDQYGDDEETPVDVVLGDFDLDREDVGEDEEDAGEGEEEEDGEHHRGGRPQRAASVAVEDVVFADEEVSHVGRVDCREVSRKRGFGLNQDFGYWERKGEGERESTLSKKTSTHVDGNKRLLIN